MIHVKCLAQCLAQRGSAPPHAGFAADISKELEYLPLIFSSSLSSKPNKRFSYSTDPQILAQTPIHLLRNKLCMKCHCKGKRLSSRCDL